MGRTAGILFIAASFLLGACSEEGANVDEYLAQYQKDYPECIKVVRGQLFVLSEEQRIPMVPHLLKACKSGRSIGEARVPRDTK